jgi:ATP-dependent protease HslVU (ClpYQ) peptidase subunit
VKKDGIAAIAADTLIKWGNAKESADYIANHDKILRVGDSYLAVTGYATFKAILRDYFEQAGEHVQLDTPASIFRTWNRLHGVLKERYYLLPEEDKEDALESSRIDCLIANPHGIFGVAAHRTVQEFSKFYAYGSGSDYALVRCTRLRRPKAQRRGDCLPRDCAAAEFDDGTGLAITSFYTLRLIPRCWVNAELRHRLRGQRGRVAQRRGSA